MKYLVWFGVLAFVGAGACNQSEVGSGPSVPSPPVTQRELYTDKARYAPGESVAFRLIGSVSSSAKIRYKHFNNILEESPVTGNSWTWTPPEADFKGYLAQVVDVVDGEEVTISTIGIDVSSSWSKFPRYGFLSTFPEMADAEMESVIENLNRHHINGVQFYDWHYRHHMPLAGTATSPADSWKDIINRENFRSTIEGYIAKAQERNMNAMFYNLVYGALNTAEVDGVSDEWYMYTSTARTDIDKYVLPKPPFVSDILFIDPSNTAWQDYINAQNSKVYVAYGFDGYHMDQVGNRDKTLYRYSGEIIDLPNTFTPFIKAAKQSAPDKSVVMNAVNQYGQESIAKSAVDFLYTEVWSPNETYNALAQIIKDNNRLSGDSKNTVLAAYINYDMANNPGYFNTPSVLLADAVIFAFGGAHLELGEHMLGKEYFPNNNLQMKEDLRKDLVRYYDFLVAYQNLLRDGGTFNAVDVKSTDGQISINPWPMQKGSVAAVGKEVGDRQVIHLLNFTKATTDQWRDNTGIQAYPGFKEQFDVVVTTDRSIKNVWFASPDIDRGNPEELPFSQVGNAVKFSIPGLEYWDMIVLQF